LKYNQWKLFLFIFFVLAIEGTAKVAQAQVLTQTQTLALKSSAPKQIAKATPAQREPTLSSKVISSSSSSSTSSSTSSSVVSKVVGKVGDYPLTSREVIAGLLLEKALFPDWKGEVVDNVDSPKFTNQVTSALLEKVVSLEAENFALASISDGEKKESLAKIKKSFSGSRSWGRLGITEVELQDFLLRKLRSKKFLKYKSEAANLTVSDYEVKDYFEKNRYKFGNLPLESFKTNIRQYLIQKQSEDRLREWFEVLRKKYQVRNFMAESGI